MNRGLLLLFGILGVVAILGIACGGGAPPPTNTVAPPPPTDTVAAPEPTTPVVTVSPTDDTEDLATKGEALAKTALPTSCVACHTTDGSPLVGPSWKGIYGSQEALTDGTTVEVNDEYLRESIVDPNAKIVENFTPNLMPATYGDTISDAGIDAIIAYIKTLQ